MSAVMTIDHMSQLVDALDRQDFPALLLERLETLVPFDLYAVFFYDGESAPACLHSNFRPARRNARCIATRAARSVITRFPASPAGHRKRRPFPARAVPLALPAPARARLRQHPAEPRRRDRLSDPGLSRHAQGAGPERAPGRLAHLAGGPVPPRRRAVHPPRGRAAEQRVSAGPVAAQAASGLVAGGTRMRVAGRPAPGRHARLAGKAVAARGRDRRPDPQGLLLQGDRAKLKIGIETVKTHRKNAYARLDVSSAPELASRFLDTLAAAACLSPPCAARAACGRPALARSDSP